MPPLKSLSIKMADAEKKSPARKYRLNVKLIHATLGPFYDRLTKKPELNERLQLCAILQIRPRSLTRYQEEGIPERKKQAAINAKDELKELLEKLQREHPNEEVEPSEQPSAEASVESNEKDATTAEDDAVHKKINWDDVPKKEKRMMRRLKARSGYNPHSFAFLEGSVLALEGKYKVALKVLGQATGVQSANQPGLYLKMANVAISMRDWDLAKNHLEQVLVRDELNALAHFGLARIAARRREWESVAKSAQASIGLHFFYAPSHFLSGLSSWHLGERKLAIHKLEQAISIDPNYSLALRTLSRFCRQSGDFLGYKHYLNLSRNAKKRRKQPDASSTSLNLALANSPGSDGIETTSSADFSQAESKDFPAVSESLVVVSGLPRTGTSMMMQMLEAGGLPIYADDHRPADPSNERGYFEHEDVKALGRNNGWLKNAKGHAVKIITQLLQNLSTSHRYRVIMMHRPLDEVIPSQNKMLSRLGKSGASISDEKLKQTYLSQVTRSRKMLSRFRKQQYVDVLDLQYHSALNKPLETAQQIKEFLGCEFDVTAAAAVVDKGLRHEVVKPTNVEKA